MVTSIEAMVSKQTLPGHKLFQLLDCSRGKGKFHKREMCYGGDHLCKWGGWEESRETTGSSKGNRAQISQDLNMHNWNASALIACFSHETEVEIHKTKFEYKYRYHKTNI